MLEEARRNLEETSVVDDIAHRVQEVPVREWLGDHAYFYENDRITRVEDPE